MNVHAPQNTNAAPVLLRERDGELAILVLNREHARNSLSEAMLNALAAAFSDIAADKTVRAVVLAANGPAFCAGHDLKELASRRGDAFDEQRVGCHAEQDTLPGRELGERSSQPIDRSPHGRVVRGIQRPAARGGHQRARQRRHAARELRREGRGFSHFQQGSRKTSSF